MVWNWESDDETTRRCLRDVVAFSTLPAMWHGAEPLRIAESLAAGLFTTLHPVFAFVCLLDEQGTPLVSVAQTDRHHTEPALARRLEPLLLEWARHHDPHDLMALAEAEPGRPVWVATRALGGNAEFGVVGAGFTEPMGPSTAHHLILNIAATQAAIGTRNALLLHSLRQSEERFRSLVDASAQIVWTASPKGEVIEEAPSGQGFTGRPRLEPQGRAWLDAIHPDDRARTEAEWRKAVEARLPLEVECRVQHVSGEWRWVSVRGVPRLDSAGEVREWVGMNIDISARKAAEDTRQLLVAELNHRVKNTLANVQAIAQHTLRRAKDPTEFAGAFGGRIQSLARIHSQLAEANWEGADLEALIRDQVVQASIESERVVTSGPVVRLNPQTALHLALALHELGTNSSKYGALSASQGRVCVDWAVQDDLLQVTWVEQGGPPVMAPTARGFGTTVVQNSLKALGGEARMTSTAGGVHWALALKLPEVDAFTGVKRAAAATERRPVGVGPSDGAGRPALVGAGRHVLVVEDEALVALNIIDIIAQMGARSIGPVHSLEEALDVIAKQHLDCALVDANLRGDPVDAIAAALTRRAIPFAFVTGYGRGTLPASFRSCPIVPKPFTAQDLIAQLEQLLTPRPPDMTALRRP